MEKLQGWVERGGTQVAIVGPQGPQGPQGPPGVGGNDSSLVTFIQAGSGAVERTAQDKMRERVSVADFGALPNGVDCHVAVQNAINYAATSGAKELYFPVGVQLDAGWVSPTYYHLGSSTLTIPRSPLKITGSKLTRITKTGAGAFFSIGVLESIGIGLEFENLWLIGDSSNGGIGFDFPGQDLGGALFTGPSMTSIHDCVFQNVGNANTYDETAGGCVRITSDCQTFKLEHCFASDGGYLIRHSGGGDNCLVRHNLSAISRSMAVQIIDIPSAGTYEISANNLANVGGSIYIRNSNNVVIFGNECLPGESGALGECVKRDYDSTSLAQNPAGHSAEIVIHSCGFFHLHDNTVSVGGAAGGPLPCDDGIFISTAQTGVGPGQVESNSLYGYTRYGIRNGATTVAYRYNMFYSTVVGSAQFSSPIQPGIVDFRWASGTGLAFGKNADPNTSVEFAVNPALTNALKLSDISTPGNWVGLGMKTYEGLVAGYLGTSGAGLVGIGSVSSDADYTGAKQFLWGLRHYDAAEKPFYWATTVANATENFLVLGGGIAAGNAATDIQFFTGATSTTPTGTIRFAITKEGYLVTYGLPTSSAGLPAGAIWSNAGVLQLA